MLTIQNIRKTFGNLEVLRDVSLEVSQGDVIAILGPSGSGKTTLLRCINYLEQADEGVMVFDGETFQMNHISRRDIARIRKKTAFVFQNYNLFLNKTALQNVTEGLIVARKIPKARAVEAGKRALDKVGLSDRYDHYPNQLSGGQQQRVACARAMMERPSVIFADEPTGNLDSRSSREVLGFLRQCVQEYGQSIVMVTHDPRAASFADRVLVLSDGSITQDMDHPTYDDILAVFAEHDDPDNGPVEVESAAKEA